VGAAAVNVVVVGWLGVCVLVFFIWGFVAGWLIDWFA